MNPLLEVNPESCMVVVGPAVTRSCLENSPEALRLSYSSLIQSGMKLLDSDERGRLQEQHEEEGTIARELDHRLCEKGLVEQWIKTHLSMSGVQTVTSTPTVQLLLKLQSQGCRLVYTYYDSILDAIAGSQPVLLSDVSLMERWLNGHTSGFLHIHGSVSSSAGTAGNISSLVLHRNHYQTNVKEQLLFVHLKELFQQRAVFFIGHNAFNPLLPELVQAFLQEDGVIKNPPIFLSSACRSDVPSCFLHLPISRSEENSLHELIVVNKESSFMTGRAADKTVDKDAMRSQAVLIFSEKQSFRKLGDIIYHLNHSGEIYVRRDALTILFGSKIMYGNILTYGGNGLQKIWDLILPKGSVLQGKGLVALGLQNALVIWINGKPAGLGSITDVNTFHSLWNNSLTALSQSKTSSPVSLASSIISTAPSPIQSSSGLSVPANYPSLLSVVPVNLVSFNPLMPIGGVSTTPMATRSFPASTQPQLILLSNQTTPTNSTLLPNLSLSNLEGNYSNTVSSRANPDPINRVSETGMGMSPCKTGTRTSPEGSTRLSCSSSSDMSPGSAPNNSGSNVLLKASPPLSLESVCKDILAHHEQNISCHVQEAPVGTLTRSVPITEPVSITGLQVTRPSSLLPHPYPVGALAHSFPLLTYSPLSYLPFPIANPEQSKSFLPTLASPLRTVLPLTTVSSLLLPSSQYTLTPSLEPATSSQQGTYLPQRGNEHSGERESPMSAHLSSPLQPSTTPTTSNSPTTIGGPVNHLWQFLLHLLLSPNHGNVIQWTGVGYEFCIIDSTTLTQMWGQASENDSLTFHGLLGELQSYSGLGILDKVEDKELTYQFKLDIQTYLRMCADTLTKKM